MARDTVPGLAETLKAARDAAALTQQQAAERSGVHAISIARFETGARGPSVASLYKLAEAYGVGVCDLLPKIPPAALPTPKKLGPKK